MKVRFDTMLRRIIGHEQFGFIVSAAILLTIAAYNMFPLIFNADSAMYIEAAYRKVVEPDRPVLYGLFIKYFSFKTSLWFVIISQSLLVSFVLYNYFSSFYLHTFNGAVKKNSNIFLIVFTALISLCMGASFQVGWLMADIFTPVAILLLGIILFVGKLSRVRLIFISILMIFSIAMHNSNFYICLGLMLLLAFFALFKPVRKLYHTSGLTFRRSILAFFLIILSNLTLSTIHYLHGGEFKSSRGGVIFLMGNVVEMGIVDKYLNEQCGNKSYELCKYKDSIPNNFLWDSKSPMRKMGGWKGSEKEYTAILKDILTTPKYLKTFVFSSLVLTLKQLATFETGEAAKPWRRVNRAVRDYHYSDFQNFMHSKQSEQKLDFTVINFLQNLVFASCFFLYLVTFCSDKIAVRYKLLAVYILSAVLVNAWICGTFSGVFPRYQSRVVWLMPLPIFLYVMGNWKKPSDKN